MFLLKMLISILRVAKMVYSSSLMEANFFTIAQRKDFAKAAEAAKRIQEIEQLNLVSHDWYESINVRTVALSK